MTRVLSADIAVPSQCYLAEGLSTLYITTAREDLTPAELAGQPHAGDIFACAPGVVGRPPNLFNA
jgi:sugar lactone lactonase YvrE